MGGEFDSDGVTLAPVDVEAEELKPGGIVGDYTITGIIGKGGWGSVYFATHADGTAMAMKVLHHQLAEHPVAVERFLREVHTVRRIQHPGIVAIRDLGRLDDGRPYFTMELLQGHNLGTLLRAEGRMAPTEAYDVVEKVCDALTAAHRAGVVHRDLKAENVLIGFDHGVKLVDFGLAKLVEPDPELPSLTMTREVLGTVTAMAPEQICGGTIDARTDIYALGVMLFVILTGTFPFKSKDPAQLLQMHLETPPQPPSQLALVSPAIDAVVLRCLEKEPEARFPSVAAFMDAFKAAVFGGELPVRPRTGIGVLVSVVADGVDDEDTLADAVVALEEGETRLRAAGYQVAFQTSREALGVIVAPLDGADERAARQAAIELGEGLHTILRGAVPEGVRVAVTIHSADVQVREGSNEIVGGKLLQVPDWSWAHDSVVVSAAAGAGLKRRQ